MPLYIQSCSLKGLLKWKKWLHVNSESSRSVRTGFVSSTAGDTGCSLLKKYITRWMLIPDWNSKAKPQIDLIISADILEKWTLVLIVFSDIISKAQVSSAALNHIHIQCKLLFQRKMLRRGHVIWWNILFQQSLQPWWDLKALQCLSPPHWFLLCIFSEEKSLEANAKNKNYSLLQIEERTACYLRSKKKKKKNLTAKKALIYRIYVSGHCMHVLGLRSGDGTGMDVQAGSFQPPKPTVLSLHCRS